MKRGDNLSLLKVAREPSNTERSSDHRRYRQVFDSWLDGVLPEIESGGLGRK